MGIFFFKKGCGLHCNQKIVCPDIIFFKKIIIFFASLSLRKINLFIGRTSFLGSGKRV